MFFRRDAYVMAGGHGAVREHILDDVMLARNIKATGWRMDLVAGGLAVRCRMYRSFAEIWQGFSKNLYDFYGRSPLFSLTAIALHFAIFVAPLPLVILSVAAHLPTHLPTLALATKVFFGVYLITVAMRCLCALFLGGNNTRPVILNLICSFGSALLHPLADTMQCAITLNSMRWRKSGQVRWKGRIYAGEGPSA